MQADLSPSIGSVPKVVAPWLCVWRMSLLLTFLIAMVNSSSFLISSSNGLLLFVCWWALFGNRAAGKL